MFSTAINQIVIRINEEVRECKTKLEVEESSRALALLQGKIAGFNKLLGFLSAEFGLTHFTIENLGDKPADLVEMDDEFVYNLGDQILALKDSELWMNVLSRIDTATNSLKDHLLFSADKTRDLDVCQGERKAMVHWESFFDFVGAQIDLRKRRAEEKRKNPELGFE